MPKRPKLTPATPMTREVLRREALKGLGALAVLPVLGAAGCSDEPAADAASDTGLSGSGGASGGAPLGGSGAGPVGGGGTGGMTSVGASTVAGAGGASVAGTDGSPSGSAGIGSGGAGSAGTAGGGAGAGSGAQGGVGGADAGMADGFLAVDFDQVSSCTLTPTDPAGEGPFFIHEDEAMDDESIRRVDLREGKEGLELQLNLRVLDSEGGCMTPISGVEVYVWHTDATGFYSGFANQNPDQTYTGGFERTVENADRFCRGVQVTDDDGVVAFRTLYPGWYNGRAIHIHFVALRPGSGPSTMSYRGSQYMVFTTQMYFEEQLSRMVHEHHAPYMARASGPSYEQYVKPQNMVVVPKAELKGEIVVAALNVVTAGSGSRR